ncbi:hypothetical protein PoMZ_06024, partial [Pyricularia oryzae]
MYLSTPPTAAPAYLRGSESEWMAARVVESEGGETATCGLEKGIKPLGCCEGERKEFLGQFELDVQTYGLTSLRTVLDGCASRDLSLGMTFLDGETRETLQIQPKAYVPIASLSRPGPARSFVSSFIPVSTSYPHLC